MKQRILVIDDEAQIRRFIRISLLAEGFEFLEAKSASEGLSLAASAHPDLIILDLGLPDKDGAWVLSRLREWSKIPVLVLTARDAEEVKVKLLEGGANDYLSKPFGIKELVVRVKVLLRDLGDMNSQNGGLTSYGDLVIDTANHRVWLRGEPITLARKEFSLLCYLARHPGQLVTQKELLEHIWGESHVEDSHYLRILISQLRKKLEDDAGSPRYILTEPGIGYRFDDVHPISHRAD